MITYNFNIAGMYRSFLFVILLLSTIRAIPQDKEICILYTNDIESVYEPIEAFWNDDIEYIGGMPYLAGLVNQIREEDKTTFLFDAGDIYTGALSAATEGRLVFDIYNHMQYDAIALGNHEFEYGWQKLAYVKNRASFPVLNCNIFYEGTDILFSQPYAIVEKDGVRIGLIGLMGEEAFKNTINPAHNKGLEARDPYPIVQELIDDLGTETDLIILLTHQNMSAPMQTDKEADPDVQRGFDEDYAMAGKIKGADVILGGHSDNGLWEPVKHPETGTLVCQTFGQGKYLGYLKLSISNNNDEIKLLEGKLIPVDNALITPDEGIIELIDNARSEHPELTEILGYANKAAYRKYYKESTIGNLFTDMLREISGADICIMNSGSFRADLNAGDITAEEVKNIYPFVDKYHIVEISGEALIEMLEYSYTLNYGFPQMSGITTKYDRFLPEGKRLIEARLKGKEIDVEKRYTIACSAFMANGGDGFSMVKEGKVVDISNKYIGDLFIDYIRQEKNIIIPPTGKQIDISAN